MKYAIKRKYEIMKLKYRLISKHMIIINDTHYSNLYDESDGNKTKIKE